MTITDELNNLLAQSGEVKFKVVNPNNGDGVASDDEPLDILGPDIKDSVIKPIQGDDSHKKIVIYGENFRKGVVVEFMKDGSVVRQQEPITFSDTRLTVNIRTRRLEAIGSFSVRVINPNSVPSNPFRPRPDITADSNE